MNLYRTWPESEEVAEAVAPTNPWLIESQTVVVTSNVTGAELYRGASNDEG